MRKALLFAPMLMLLLTACGGGEEKDPAAELQAQYAAVESAVMEADITCHYEDEVRTYTLLCDYTPAKSTVTVLSPTNLAGISATVADGTLSLSYEDISLDAGGYSAAAISPVAALPKLMTAAASGYVTERSEETLGERPCLRLACDLPDDEGTLYTTWYDQQTLLPLRSEISSDGTMVFEIAWTRFELTAKDSGTAAQPDGQTDGQAETEMDWTEADEAAAYAAAEE
ncbi:MAG: hypothetical protein HFF80_03860 [Oscillospiraceae bacterium]|nr:hypothetical protein [Oscillospiraceae bacterium]